MDNSFLVPVQDWNDAVVASMTYVSNGVAGFLPKLLGAIIVIVVGWVLAYFAKRLLVSLLGAIKFDNLAEQLGLTEFLQRAGYKMTPKEALAEIVRWLVVIVFLLAGISILGFPTVTSVLNGILAYIPNVVVAVLILTGGLLLANFLADILRGTLKSLDIASADMMAQVAKWILIVFTVLAVIRQLEIVPDLINILFIGIIGATALAFGLAFGLGGRDVASKMLNEWYENTRKLTQEAKSRAAARPQEPSPRVPTPVREDTRGGKR